MGVIFFYKKCEVWKIYHTEYGPFLATDWLKAKKVGGSWSYIRLQFNSSRQVMGGDLKRCGSLKIPH